MATFLTEGYDVGKEIQRLKIVGSTLTKSQRNFNTFIQMLNVDDLNLRHVFECISIRYSKNVANWFKANMVETMLDTSFTSNPLLDAVVIVLMRMSKLS